MKKQFSFCLFLLPSDELSSVDIPKIRNSVEFIKDVSSKVIHLLDTLEIDGKLIKTPEDSNQFIQVRKQFVDSEKARKRSTKWNHKYYSGGQPLNVQTIIGLFKIWSMRQLF